MIPQWIKDIAKGLVALLLYSLGRRDATIERDAKESKADLDWRISRDEKREEVRRGSKMKIEIKVKIGDLQVDFDEAKKIYEALKPLFETQTNSLLEIYRNNPFGSPKSPMPWDQQKSFLYVAQ